MLDASLKNARILMVDDQESNLELLAGILERSGYTDLQSITDSQQTLACLEQFQPDLILLDLHMPQLDGYAVMEQLRGRIPNAEYLPILVLTADITTEAKLRALAGGASDFLAKPLDVAEVALRVKNLLQTRYLHLQQRNLNQLLEDKVGERTAELASSEARYRALVEQMPGVAYSAALDEHASTLFVSSYIEALLGFSAAEWTADPTLWENQIHPEDRPATLEKYNRAVLENISFEAEYRICGKRGEIHWVLDRARIVPDANGRSAFMHGIMMDLTERVRAELAEREQRALAEALRDTAAALNSTLDIDAVLDRILDNVGRVVAHDGANIMLREGDTLRVVRDRGYAERGSGNLQGMCFHLHELPGLREIFETGNALVVPDSAADPRWVVVPESRWVRSFLGAPIRAHGEIVGLLNLDSARPNFYDETRLAGVQGFADQAGTALYNAQLLRETRQHLQQIQALHTIDRAINASLDLNITFDVFMGELFRLLPVDAADILLLNRYAPVLEFAVGRGFKTAALQKSRVRVGDGYAGTAALEQRLVHVPDLAAELDGLNRAPLLPQEGFVSYFAVPLIAKGRVVGVLELFTRKRVGAPETWTERIQALALQAAMAIENARLFDDLRRANTELRIAYDATIEGWSRALDLRDKETEGHTQRVTAMTGQLARALGVADAELAHWLRGALLHDIGKMGVPDAILHKPGPLTGQEWEIMRRHPLYAYEMLEPIAYLQPALDIPYCHHERWDGSGYPRGLKGEQIPLAARVFAVVDVWDALSSDRPYRAAWNKARVLDHIRQHAGTHFDPHIVRVFLAQAPG